MFREEKCLEFVFEGLTELYYLRIEVKARMPFGQPVLGRESSRVPDVLGEVVPDVRTEIGERAKAMSFAVEVSEFVYACV